VHRAQALWLANMSSMILFWPYLKAAINTPIKQMMGRTMVFKTTLKGAAAKVASLKTLGAPLLIVIVNVVTFIIGIAHFRIEVNAAQAISLCWLVFNTIPHVTLLLNSSVGPGSFMVAWCRIGMLLTTASSALAVVLMWLLYPREIDFMETLNSSLFFLRAEVSGRLPLGYTPQWRGSSGEQLVSAHVDAPNGIQSVFRPALSIGKINVTRDLSGGFYEDGPWGPIKLTKNNAFSTAMLAWGVLDKITEQSFRSDPARLVRPSPCTAAAAAGAAARHSDRARPFTRRREHAGLGARPHLAWRQVPSELLHRRPHRVRHAPWRRLRLHRRRHRAGAPAVAAAGRRQGAHQPH
jgi:Glycosyl hydrolase family 9